MLLSQYGFAWPCPSAQLNPARIPGSNPLLQALNFIAALLFVALASLH
jgi:hypothetical protein